MEWISLEQEVSKLTRVQSGGKGCTNVHFQLAQELCHPRPKSDFDLSVTIYLDLYIYLRFFHNFGHLGATKQLTR